MKKSFYLISLFIAFVFFGCNNSLVEKKENSVEQMNLQKAIVSFSFEDSSRSIRPNILSSLNLTNIVIEGTLQDEETYSLKQSFFSSNEMYNSPVILEPGIWNFSITAYRNNLSIKGQLKNKTIEPGNNILKFPIEIESLGQEGDVGSISMRLTYASPSGGDLIKGAKAGLFSLDNDEVIPGFGLKVLTTSIDDASGYTYVSYQSSEVPVGVYRIKVFLYADQNCNALINTYREIVTVADQCESTGNFNIYSLNEIFTINYKQKKDDGNDLEDVTFISSSLKKAYTKNSEFLLPDATDVIKNGNVFVGWYENQDFSGAKITSIQKNTTGTKTFYAKWQPGAPVSETRPLDLSGASGEYNVIVFENADLTALANEIRNASTNNLNIRLDLSESNITELQPQAFSNCSKISSIVLSDKITVIGEYAFENCSDLVEIITTNNSQLVTIGKYAFANCSELISFEIPSSVNYIGQNAFTGCNTSYFNYHTVTFKTNDGQVVDAISVKHNTCVTRPVDPVKTGYVFDYWYKQPQGSVTVIISAYDFTSPVTEDITLVQKWKN